MTAYYNEIDRYAAQWLRNLIAAGHIAPGEVDERSICDVRPDDLRGYKQCHFFAGIGGWSRALRLAGWPDDRPVWTGSCPCQPFSGAGKKGGGNDKRHLWPVWFRLIQECGADTVFGEQVEGAVGFGWLDRVFADMEDENHACGAAVLGAHSVRAPHIRQRLWWVAQSASERREMALQHDRSGRTSGSFGQADERGGDSSLGRLADAQSGGRGQGIADTGGLREGDGAQGSAGRSAQHGDAWVVADADHGRRFARGGDDQAARYGDPVAAAGGSDCSNVADGDKGRQLDPLNNGVSSAGMGSQQPSRGGCGGNVGDAHGAGRQQHGGAFAVEPELKAAERGGGGAWANSIWLTGADGKARRVEPSICLLAHGVFSRVGRLRAYGNAIVPQVAAEFIKAYMIVPAKAQKATAPAAASVTAELLSHE